MTLVLIGDRTIYALDPTRSRQGDRQRWSIRLSPNRVHGFHDDLRSSRPKPKP
ncbi:MAG: hypothetical protein WBA43_09225 [Elainellaceae cyanobacterium]